jgi:branched-chain amino acid transport system substrate-binding protein
MRGVKRLWSRKLALVVGVVAAAATTMGVSKCGGSGSSTITVTGTALTIYASVPSCTGGMPSDDVGRAELLALKQAGFSAGKFKLRFGCLDAMKPSDNARTAIDDTSAIAYLGEIEPGASAQSMGINEDQDLLQVSPTDTAIALTKSTPAVPGAPKSYYEQYGSYGKTFARVVPSASAEATAQVQQMRALAVKKLYVANDGSDYGKALAYAVRHDAQGAGLTVATGPASAASFTSSGADALFLADAPGAEPRAAALFEQIGSRAKLFVPSALDDSALASALGSAKLSLYASQPGFLPRDLTPAAEQQFFKPFEAAYGHAPQTQAIFGYEAMSAVLAVLREAGTKANARATVVHDFFGIKNRQSVLGTYSIDSNGDPSIGPFVFSRLSSGVLVPYKFVQTSP